jgi:hypothetical protein
MEWHREMNEKRCIAHQIILELFEGKHTGQIQLLLMVCALAAKQLDPESFRKFSEHSVDCMNADQVAAKMEKLR